MGRSSSSCSSDSRYRKKCTRHRGHQSRYPGYKWDHERRLKHRGRSRSRDSSSGSERGCRRKKERRYRGCRHCRKRERSSSREANPHILKRHYERRHATEINLCARHCCLSRRDCMYHTKDSSDTGCLVRDGRIWNGEKCHCACCGYHHLFCCRSHFRLTSTASRTSYAEDALVNMRKERPLVGLCFPDRLHLVPTDHVAYGRKGSNCDRDHFFRLQDHIEVVEHSEGGCQDAFACLDMVEKGSQQKECRSQNLEVTLPTDFCDPAEFYQGDWLNLTLERSKVSSLNMEDVHSEDFRLGLPGDSHIKFLYFTNTFDLNTKLESSDEDQEHSIAKFSLSPGNQGIIRPFLSAQRLDLEGQPAGCSEPQGCFLRNTREIKLFGHKIVMDGDALAEKSLFVHTEDNAVNDSSSLHRAERKMLAQKSLLISTEINAAGDSLPISDSERQLGSETVMNGKSNPPKFKEHYGRVECSKEKHQLAAAHHIPTEVIILDDSEDGGIEEDISIGFGGMKFVQEERKETELVELRKKNYKKEHESNLIAEVPHSKLEIVPVPVIAAMDSEDKCIHELCTQKSITSLPQQGHSSEFLDFTANSDQMGWNGDADGTDGMLLDVEIIKEASQKDDKMQASHIKLRCILLEESCVATPENFHEDQSEHLMQSCETTTNSDGLGSGIQLPSNLIYNSYGFKLRKKRMAHKALSPLQCSDVKVHEQHAPSGVNDLLVALQKAHLNKIILAKPRMFDVGIWCDLCRRGPSLSLGEWYSWCCGTRLFYCHCSTPTKLKLTSLLTKTKKNCKSKRHEDITWSGKVHKMCALWSSEVFERDDEGDKLEGLFDAVRRGRSLTCAAAGCRELGATLGCRVKNCRRSFHYPCADKLASQLRCRMWDGVYFPVACQGHRHVEQSCQNAKEKHPSTGKWKFVGNQVIKSWKQKQNIVSGRETIREQGTVVHEDGVIEDAIDTQEPCRVCPSMEEELQALTVSPTAVSSLQNSSCTLANESHKNNDDSLQVGTTVEFLSDNEDINKEERCIEISNAVESSDNGTVLSKCLDADYLCKSASDGDDLSSKFPSYEERRSMLDHAHSQLPNVFHVVQKKKHFSYLGENLLCQDISYGRESVMIPCTNDVDDDPGPVFEYITESRYLEKAKRILEHLLLDKDKLAKSCEGCNPIEMDDPEAELSAHVWVKNRKRSMDERFDWQGQPMFGRLPYDRYGRLQLGPATNDVVECNSRCPCGSRCLNRELQKGLQISLEVFKTKDRGWGVRAMEPIPRGKFIVEYVGEILTPSEADECGAKYDMSNFSCLFSADHPDVPLHDLLVVDGYKMSNVARFINHSCEGNLRIYRIYSEITDLRFCRIGMYAGLDIEIGEELTYDYKYSNSRDNIDVSGDPTAIKCLCGARTCRQWLWTGGA